MKTNSQPPLLKAKSCLSTEGEIVWQIKYLVPGPSQSLTKSLTITDRKVPDSQTCTDASRVRHFAAPDVFAINLCVQQTTQIQELQGKTNNNNNNNEEPQK